MRKLLSSSLLAALALLLGGCFELTQVFFINPDGSGKVQIENVMAPPPQMGPGAGAPDTAQMAKQALQGMIIGSAGVEAWSDVTSEVTKEGKVHIKATAYFTDLSKLKIGQGPGSGGGQMTWTKAADGGKLELDIKGGAEAGKPENLTDAQVAEQVKQMRAEYQQSKGMMQMILSGLKVDTSFNLPGAVGEAAGLKKKAGAVNAVQFVIDGKQMMEAMDKFVADDKAMAAAAKAGKAQGDMPAPVREQIFGTTGNLMAKVAGAMKPLFDYKVETEKAKAGQAEMFKKLGVDPNAKPMMPGGMPMPPQ